MFHVPLGHYRLQDFLFYNLEFVFVCFRPLRLEIVYRGAFRIRSLLETIKTKKTVLISGEDKVNFLRESKNQRIRSITFATTASHLWLPNSKMEAS